MSNSLDKDDKKHVVDETSKPRTLTNTLHDNEAKKLSECLTTVSLTPLKELIEGQHDTENDGLDLSLIEKVQDDDKRDESTCPLKSDVSNDNGNDGVEIEVIERSKSFVEASANKNEVIQVLVPVSNYLLNRRRKAKSFRLDSRERKRRLSVLIEEPAEIVERPKTEGNTTDKRQKYIQTLNQDLFGVNDPSREFKRGNIRLKSSASDKKKRSVSFKLDSDDRRKREMEEEKPLEYHKSLTDDNLKDLIDVSKDRLLTLSSISSGEWTTLTSDSLKKRDYTILVGEDSNKTTTPLVATGDYTVKVGEDSNRSRTPLNGAQLEKSSEETSPEHVKMNGGEVPECQQSDHEFDEENKLLNFLHDNTVQLKDLKDSEMKDKFFARRKMKNSSNSSEETEEFIEVISEENETENEQNDNDDDDFIDKVAEYQNVSKDEESVTITEANVSKINKDENLFERKSKSLSTHSSSQNSVGKRYVKFMKSSSSSRSSNSLL